MFLRFVLRLRLYAARATLDREDRARSDELMATGYPEVFATRANQIASRGHKHPLPLDSH